MTIHVMLNFINSTIGVTPFSLGMGIQNTTTSAVQWPNTVNANVLSTAWTRAGNYAVNPKNMTTAAMSVLP